MTKEELIVLGTGNALATRCYNTCFALRGEEGLLLVDSGGGNGIIKQLRTAGIPLTDIHDIFITHQHTDHLLGLFWLIRLMVQFRRRGKDAGECRIYCHCHLAGIIEQTVPLLLEEKLSWGVGDFIHIVPVEDGEVRRVAGWDVTFFDVHSTKVPQFGCCVELKNGGRLTCLGDEPLNPKCEQRLKGCKWLLCEAFCLYSQRDIYRPYEKHHTTVREACEIAQNHNIPNLVLWHTEDDTLPQRKVRYRDEGREFYTGNLLVPDDLEVITLD